MCARLPGHAEARHATPHTLARTTQPCARERWICCGITFDMSGKQRRTHCCRSGTKAPAVVCPLDGGVRLLTAHGSHFQRSQTARRCVHEPQQANGKHCADHARVCRLPQPGVASTPRTCALAPRACALRSLRRRTRPCAHEHCNNQRTGAGPRQRFAPSRRCADSPRAASPMQRRPPKRQCSAPRRQPTAPRARAPARTAARSTDCTRDEMQ
jgi:hypothetical protein